MLLLNILLALAWGALTAKFSPINLFFGFIIGYLILWLARRSSSYFTKVPKVIGFVFFFFKELIRANLRVTYDVLTRSHHMRPGVIAIPLSLETDAQITILANLISLTPGTLSLDVSDDRRTLYIHAMYVDDVNQLRQEIKSGFERRVQEVFE